MRILPALLITIVTATSASAGSINLSPMPIDLKFPQAKSKSVTVEQKSSTKAYVAPGKTVKSPVRKMPRHTSK